MQELVGKRFGKWTVLSFEGKINRVNKFKVKCDCGNESISDYIALTRGKSTKCRSCARKISCKGERNPSFKHGYSCDSHPEFHMHYIWCSIKQRCNNPKVKNYHRYGGRGIKMCPSWENNFEQFLNDMGKRPKGYSIERIDNNLGYNKENCRWADKDTQANNTLTNIYYTYEGIKATEAQWARRFGLTRNKFMYWAKKNGIEWVAQNIEKLKKTHKGMSDQEYLDLGLDLPEKRFR